MEGTDVCPRNIQVCLDAMDVTHLVLPAAKHAGCLRLFVWVNAEHQ